MANKHFTTIVELKLPNTPLFGSVKNRSGSWSLSNDLFLAVSQILEQKAEWTIKSKREQYDEHGQKINQRKKNIASQKKSRPKRAAFYFNSF